MSLQPKVKAKKILFKKCEHCGSTLPIEEFLPTRSFFYPDGVVPFCTSCLKNLLRENNFNWVYVDKLCQYLDIPFVPQEFERLHKDNGDDVFPIYCNVFKSQEYESLGWGDYFQKFKELKAAKVIENELPEIKEKHLKELQAKWGPDYCEEELEYLEDLLQGILNTQNVNGKISMDQAKKICKISLLIDSRIRSGTDFDKLLASYDKLVKLADFTPKNVKSASDFESVGELCRWLEKKGWQPKFYDDVSKDIVDETMQNIETFNRRLYTNESGISEDIERRVKQLKEAKQSEDYYNTNKEYDLDMYEKAGFDEVFDDDDGFVAEVEDGGRI